MHHLPRAAARRGVLSVMAVTKCPHDLEEGQCSICHVQRPSGVLSVMVVTRCPHDFEDGQCSICHVQRPPGVSAFVYITDGGETYHEVPDCPSMEKGQDKVHERGGQPSDVRRVTYDHAVSLGRRPCVTCYPHLYGRGGPAQPPPPRPSGQPAQPRGGPSAGPRAAKLDR